MPKLPGEINLEQTDNLTNDSAIPSVNMFDDYIDKNKQSVLVDDSGDVESSVAKTRLSVFQEDSQIQGRDQAKKLLELEGATGLPSQYIMENMSEAEKLAKDQSFSVDNFIQKSPKFAKWAAENPAHVPFFNNDIPKYQELESQSAFGRGMDEASILAKKNLLIAKRFNGSETPADLKAESEFDAQLKELEFLKEGESFTDKVASAAGYTVRQSVDSLGAAATGGGVGLAVGAVAAPFTGGASLAASAVSGLTLGSLSGVALSSYEMETNFAYDEISKIEGVDRETAKNVARGVGAINAAIETLADISMFKRIPGADKLINFVEGKLSKNAGKLAAQALARPTTRQAVANSAKKLVEGSGIEYAQEFVQSLVGSTGQVVAAGIDDVESGVTFGGAFLQAHEEGWQALLGTAATFGVLHGASNFHTHIQNIREGDYNQKFFDALAQGAQSESFRELPEKGQEAVKNILAGSGSETTYFQSDEWDAYWNAKGLNPRDVAVEVAQDGGASYDQAFDGHGFIAIPTERVGRKLLHNNEHKELLNDATLDLNKATPRQAKQAEEDLKKEIESKKDQGKSEVQSDSEKKLEQKIYQQLVDARVPGDARTNAKLFAKIASTIAKKNNQTGEAAAESLLEKYGFNISRVLSQRIEQQKIDSSDPWIDMIRANKVPNPDSFRGQSMVEFIKSKGGIRPTELTGELAAIDEGKKGFQRISNKKSKFTIDEMAQLLMDEGYFNPSDYGNGAPTEAEVIDAIQREMSGQPVYAFGKTDDTKYQDALAIQQFADQVKSLGIDLSTSDNETIKKALSEATKNARNINPGELGSDIYLQFAGRSSLEHDAKKLMEAYKLYQNGSDMEAIRKKTGWFMGADNRWRYEISDKNAKLKDVKIKRGATYKLSEVLDHKELFKAYPQLKEYKVILGYANGNNLGSFNLRRKEITVNVSKTVKGFEKEQNELNALMDTPEYEAFAKEYRAALSKAGQNLAWSNFRKNEVGKKHQELSKKIWGSGVKASIPSNMSELELKTVLHEIQHAIQDIEKFAQGTGAGNSIKSKRNYFNTMGEIEARDTEKRRSMTDAQRAGLTPSVQTWSNPIIDWNGVAAELPIELLPDDSEIKQFFIGEQMTLFQGMTQPNELGFYSRMIRTIEEKMGTSASVEQVNGMLKEIKPEERKWLGLDEYLKSKTKVNKEELLQYLRANDLQIKEITKQDGYKIKKVERRDVKEVTKSGGNWYVDFNNGAQVDVREFDAETQQEAIDQAIEKFNDDVDQDSKSYIGDKETKFGSYQLPGGEHYREVLFTLPQKFIEPELNNISETEWELGGFKIKDTNGANYEITKGGSVYARRNSFGAALDWVKADLEKVNDQQYRSSHFDETNILAHTRLNDRIDSEGNKVLFVEEIQSDWHQEGRKQGYKDTSKAKSLREELKKIEKPISFPEWLNKELEGMYSLKQGEKIINTPSSERTQEINKLVEEYYAYANPLATKREELRIEANKLENGVAEAPFKKTWHEFVMKRIIRMASEQGYDKIAWTTGEQQADRYNLAKQVDAVNAKKNENGTYRVIAEKDGRAIHQSDNLSENDLETQLGKDLAKKIVDESGKENKILGQGFLEYKGDDLKVGGEGMKGFYDKILVDFANKFGKKYGARVGDLELSTGPAMYNIIDGFRGGKSEVVHSLEITPQLKDAAINEGFTLFQGVKKQPQPLGSMTISPDRKMSINLYAKADFSTFAHEQAHFWLEVMGDIAEDPSGSEEIKKMYFDALKWMGVANRSEIKREHHEMFAEGFEKYLMEGKAPTSELQRVFNVFKSWLEFVYRSLRQLNVELSPEIRSVFNRMLATDEEIKKAQESQSFSPLIPDPAMAGMTPDQVEKYSKLVAEAKEEATNALLVKTMKQLQTERTKVWKDEQAEVKTEVVAMVDAREDITLLKMLKAGKLEGRSDMPIKLSRKILEDAYGKEFVDSKLPRYIFGKDGMSHEELASLLGFDSGWSMVEMIANTPDRDGLINQMVMDEMVKRYGDQDVYLNGDLFNAALDAVHNDKQAELMRFEYDWLQQNRTKEMKGVVKAIARRAPMVSFVREKAESMILDVSVGSIKPYLYLRAEKKFANEAIDKLQKGDFVGAAEAKKKELLNHELYRAATKAKEKIDSIEGKLNKFFQEDAKLAKTRDMNLIGVGRAILSSYGFGKSEKTPEQWLEQIGKYDQDSYALLLAKVRDAQGNADYYENLTYDKFLALFNVLDGIWKQSKSEKMVQIDGKKIENEIAIEELLHAAGKLPSYINKTNNRITQTENENSLNMFQTWIARAKRAEAKLGVMDAIGGGAFKKYFFNEIRSATEIYRAKKGELNLKFNELVQKHKDIFTGGEIIAKDLGGAVFKNKAELLGAMVHTGNESNLRKLLIGNGWGSKNPDGSLDTRRWDAFIADMIAKNIIEKEDYDFIQGVWDLFESFKPDAQRAHYEMHGHYFGEIEAKPLKTPFGVYAGGYVPATPDNSRSKDAAIRNERKQIEEGFMSELPPKLDGFTKSRVESYATPLLMDLSAIPSQIDRTLRFTYITPRVKEVTRLVHNKELRNELDRYDPGFVSHVLIPFLTRSSTQSTVVQTNSKLADSFYSFAKNNAAIQIMFLNIPNIIQQTANYIPAALRSHPKYLFNAIKEHTLKNKETTEKVAEKSLFMKNLLNKADDKARFETEKVLENYGQFTTASKWVEKNAYIGQIYLQNIMNVQVWLASYDQAVSQEMSEIEAVRYADSAVRETQSSMAAEDTADIETSTPLMKSLMMFFGFFNNMGNLYSSEWGKANASQGREYAKKALIAANFGLFAFAGQIIIDALKGNLPGDDDEDNELAYWTKYAFGASFSLVAPMAGVFGQLLQTGVKTATGSSSYGNRVSVSPLISTTEQVISSLGKLSSDKNISDKEKVKSTMSMLGMMPLISFVPLSKIPMTGNLPNSAYNAWYNAKNLSGAAATIGALKRPVGYAVGVNEGKDKAETPMDVVGGVLGGSAK